MKIEVRDLEYFAVVARRRHVGHAADVLGLSQPALSKSLRRLENSLRVKLVARTPRGVDLTAAGAALAERARRLSLTIEDIAREAGDLSEGRAGRLRICTSGSAGLQLVPKACEILRKTAPKVTLTISVGAPIGDTLAAVRNGDSDLAVAWINPSHHDDLTHEALYDEAYVVFAAESHRLAKRRQLHLADLVPESWVFSAGSSFTEAELNREFRAKHLPPPHVAIETTNLPLRQQLVASTELLGFSPRGVLGSAVSRLRLAELRVTDLAFTRRVSISYRRDAYLSPAARLFIDILKTTAGNITTD